MQVFGLKPLIWFLFRKPFSDMFTIIRANKQVWLTSKRQSKMGLVKSSCVLFVKSAKSAIINLYIAISRQTRVDKTYDPFPLGLAL